MFHFRVLFDETTCNFKSVTEMGVVDFSATGGIWTPCAGSVSPWNTHLGSEEYEPNARYINSATTLETMVAKTGSTVIAMMRYFDVYPESISTMADVLKVFNPYNYGEQYTTCTLHSSVV
jgi:hypothetical protein